MAWSYEQKFNTLNTADLNGQDSWSGSANFDVQTTTKYEGAKGVQVIGDGAGVSLISRSITAITDGVVYWAWRRSSNSAGNSFLWIYDGATVVFSMWWETDGHFHAWNNVTDVDLGVSSINTWYVMQLELDAVGDQWRLKIYPEGGPWGAWLGWYTVRLGSATQFDSMALRVASDVLTTWYDTITPTDPTIVPSAGGQARGYMTTNSKMW